MSACKLAECDRPSVDLGYCARHYQRFIKHGDPTAGTLRNDPRYGRLCSYEKCSCPHYAKGFCCNHYQRLKKFGDPEMRKAPPGSGTLHNGYRVFYVNGRRKREHDSVAEAMIGRPLTKDEVVHHINGDKLDNRQQNLQVMTRSEHMKLHRKMQRLAKTPAL